MSYRHRRRSQKFFKSLLLIIIFPLTVGILLSALFLPKTLILSLISINSRFLIVTCFILFSLISLSYSVVLIKQGFYGIIERNGRYFRTIQKPGIHLIIPVLDHLILLNVKGKEINRVVKCLTGDDLTVGLQIQCSWIILDACKAYYEVEDVNLAVENFIETSLRNHVGRLTLERLLEEIYPDRGVPSFLAIETRLEETLNKLESLLQFPQSERLFEELSSLKESFSSALKKLLFWRGSYNQYLPGAVFHEIDEITEGWGARVRSLRIGEVILSDDFLERIQRLKRAELDKIERQHQAELARIDAVEAAKTEIMTAELKVKAQKEGVTLTPQAENKYREKLQEAASQIAITIINENRVEASAVADSNNQNINISNSQVGDINQVAADTIQNAFNKVTQSSADPALKTELEKLNKAVAEMIKLLPEERQREVAQDLKTLTDEATSESPRRKWYELSAEGLLEAAKAVGKTATPVINAVQAVLPLIAAV